jgi:cation transport regulator ChaC
VAFVTHYFAYGSNMNPARVRGRELQFDHHLAGTLHDFRLAFNKRSVKFPGAASANVMKHQGARTEGVVYKMLHPEQISMMDPYEGYPVRYSRQVLPIVCGSSLVNAWVYIAKDEFITTGLKPARWYLEHLLAGREFLTRSYFEELTTVECLPNSGIEPD